MQPTKIVTNDPVTYELLKNAPEYVVVYDGDAQDNIEMLALHTEA